MVLPWGSKTDFFKVTNTRALAISPYSPSTPSVPPRALGAGRRRREHAAEDRVHVAEVALEAEDLGQLGGGEDLLDLRVLGDAASEVAVRLPRLHGVALHHAVGVLPPHPTRGQLEQELAGEHEALRGFEVLPH